MNQTTESFKHFAPWLLAFFLTALGAQLWVVWLYGSPLPLWDQWYEASFFKSWLAGQLRWTDFFAAHNEHRILATRLLDLTLIDLNGRWEPLLQMTVNAFIHSGYSCVLALCLWDFLGRKNGWLVCSLLMPFFALPYGGENTIWGFNSQNYFASLFALVSLWGLGFEQTGSWRWWSGCLASILGLFTSASGLLAPVAVAGLVLLRTIRNRRIERHNLITPGVCLLIVGLGASLSERPQYHAVLQAHNFGQFTAALTRNLSWPFFHAPIMPCLIVLPLAFLLALYLRPNFQWPRTAEFLLALALWGALQSVVIAYGRANYGEDVPASRYMDLLNVFVIAGVFTAVLLAELSHSRQLGGGILAFVYMGIIFYGLCRISQIVVDDLLVPTRVMNLVAEERVRTFTVTGNKQELFEPPTVPPDPKVTLDVLRDPKLQTILPAICLPSTPAGSTGRLAPASQWLLQHSVAILSTGLLVFSGLCGWRLAWPAAGFQNQATVVVALLCGLAALGFVWSKRSARRESVEYELGQRIVADFKSAGNFKRAALYERTMQNPDPFAN